MRALSGIDIVVHASAMKQIVAAEYNLNVLRPMSLVRRM